MNRLRRFILNGMLMAVVAVIMRTVALAFNVYISNRIGAVAMGLFSLISTVYGFALTFATSGISLATTRLIAEAIGDTSGDRGIPKERRGEVRCMMRRCVLYALFFGGIASLLLWLMSDYIGCILLRDARTVSSLRLLALTLLPTSLATVFCGYFSAARNVYKNAFTQVLGQGIKIYFTVALISSLGARDIESACLCVVGGGALAEFISFTVTWLLYIIEKKRGGSNIESAERKKATKKLLANALPVAFSAYMRSALVTIEHILIPRGLEKSGASKDASLAAYGTVSSMVFPLVLFPSAISASFAGLLIPEVAECTATKNTRRLCGIICTVLETVLIFSIGCAGVIMSFSLELGSTVYTQSASAGKYILYISPLIPIMYLDTAVDSMLKGMGEQVYTMWVNIADALISVILVAVLLPKMGINGYIVTVYFTEILNATLSITRLLVKSKVKTHTFLWVGRPLLCVMGATHITHFLSSKMPFYNVWYKILISAAIYIALLILSGGIKPKVVADRIRYMFHIK